MHVTFLRFSRFVILSTFFILKKFTENSIKSLRSTFEATERLDFIMKVTGYRAALYPLRAEHNILR